jgi:hypothetical protein
MLNRVLFYLWRSPLQFLIRKYILDRAWLDGYLTACAEIKRERALMLSALERLTATEATGFYPSKPVLPFVEPELLDAWDATTSKSSWTGKFGAIRAYLRPDKEQCYSHGIGVKPWTIFCTKNTIRNWFS